MSLSDEVLMARALRLAEACLQQCVMAPRTAVLVVRDGEVASEHLGVPNPEQAWANALAGGVEGATLVSPVAPPLGVQDQLMASAPARLVLGQGWRGVGRLELATEVLQQSCARLNPAAGLGRPLVRMKLAMSVDGRTALAHGISKWITGEAARADVQNWRARSAALVTGVGTVLADDPRLTVRTGSAEVDGVRRQRIVLDSGFRTPATATLLQDAQGTVEIWGLESPPAGRPECRAVSPDADGRVSLAAVVSDLGDRGCQEILFECGAELAGAVLKSGLLDELVVYIAPKFLGHRGRALVILPDYAEVASELEMVLADSRKVGEDIRLIFRSRDTTYG